ncbi:hypothetical protein BDA99DRAFT_463281 [Phascolomyces articulosus]|uniref:Uncharacterized protein n=1 Tax=Phascolomyces articulosus TaxID=60185 RepID=A0AAD5K162_9FUNG|nr:hypothetical protein BDA99DRAFT_463281 [Phascolomyces articulosus]
MDPTNKKQKTTTDENAHPENDDDDKDEQYDELSDGSASSIDSTMEREVEWSFWDSCRDILMSAEMNLEINQFSPHKHGVIVCGDKLLQTEENAIDPAVYTLVVKHMNSGNDFSIDRSVTFAEVEEYFTAVFGAEKSNMVDCARNPVPATDPKKRNFIADMTLSIFRDIYDSESNLKHSESMVNSTCLHPAIRFACQAVTKGKLLFYPGEERLNAMNMVLGDDTVIYRGDAIVRMRGALELEVLLLETSNALGACTESKKAFDFYKALYGGVAMLKSIANQFKYGDIKLFKRIKVYFLHASKEEVRLWSVQYVSRHIYVVCREDTAKMPYDYNDLPSDITYFIHFFWVLKLRLENTISSIESLITDHEKKKKNDIYGTLSASENLEIIVEPIPIRLTERVHINKVPNHPDSFS